MFNLDAITNGNNKDHNKKMVIQDADCWAFWQWKNKYII